MKTRILALGAVLVLTASTMEAQGRGQGKGFGRGKATADSTARKGGDDKARRDARSDEDSNGRDGGRGGFGAMGRNGGYLLSGIELTEQQKTRVKAIRESYRPRMQALRDSAKVAHQDKAVTAADTVYRTRSLALANAERAEIRAVLTPEQHARFDANVRTMDERMSKRFGDRGKGKGKKGDRSGGSRP